MTPDNFDLGKFLKETLNPEKALEAHLNKSPLTALVELLGIPESMLPEKRATHRELHEQKGDLKDFSFHFQIGYLQAMDDLFEGMKKLHDEHCPCGGKHAHDDKNSVASIN